MAYQKELLLKYPSRKQVPIVAVTAYEDDDTINKCLKVGISRVINKPVSYDLLEKIINEFYQGPLLEKN